LLLTFLSFQPTRGYTSETLFAFLDIEDNTSAPPSSPVLSEQPVARQVESVVS